MQKFNSFSGYEEEYYCELRNSDLTFFAGPPLKSVAKLSEQEFNQLVEQRRSALRKGDCIKNGGSPTSL